MARTALGRRANQAYWGYETWGVLGNKEGVGTPFRKSRDLYDPVDTKFHAQDFKER